jgi:hypothetical protein
MFLAGSWELGFLRRFPPFPRLVRVAHGLSLSLSLFLQTMEKHLLNTCFPSRRLIFIPARQTGPNKNLEH